MRSPLPRAPLLLAAACAHPTALPDDPRALALQARGAAALVAGDVARAQAAFEVALELAPELPEALLGLGLAARARGDARAAAGWLHRALRAAPDLAAARADLGLLALEAGRLEEAERWLRAALAVDPTLGAARHDLALVLQETGRLREAAAERERLAALAEAAPRGAVGPPPAPSGAATAERRAGPPW